MGQAAPTVFYLDALSNHEIVYGFRSALLLRDQAAGRENYAAFNRGELPYDDMPDGMALREDAGQMPPSPLPHIFVAGDYLSVSEAVAAVLREFGLGASLIKPVIFLNQDQATTIARGWNLFQIKEFKTGLEMTQSMNMPKPMFPRPDVYPASFAGHMQQTRPAINGSVLQGPDVWIDRRVANSVFVSAALFECLRARKLLGPVKHLPCPVLATDSLKAEEHI